MSEAAEKPDLLVFEYGGSARSGKGTIVDHLAKTRPGVTKDETGLYYRKLTRDFLKNGTIDASMSSHRVISTLSDIPIEELVAMLVNREKWGDEQNKKELYLEDVNRLVADVGQVSNARKAVKDGFADRIKNLVDSGTYQSVVIDGRNLTEVVKAIDGACMVLRTFVDCLPYEAALRECMRNKIELDSPEGQRILDDIELRNYKDQTRKEDPMVVDGGAIDFWEGSHTKDDAWLLRQCRSSTEYLTFLKNHKDRYPFEALPNGAGNLAVSSGSQIFFDTTPFRLFEDPISAMLNAAEQMFDEALRLNLNS